jgi:hypothetical protein
MTNRDLITKLNSLKNISPDNNWLKSNRELLLSQISNSGATDLSIWKVFVINFQSVAKAASRPAFALGAFVLIMISAGLFSQSAFSKTKPNDSLYIARIISEKVKLNTVFDSQARNKLAVQFASEHAQDISAVLADPEFNTEANQDQVAKLNDSFKKEVVTVKEGMNRLAATAKSQTASVQPEIKNLDVVIADSSKDAQGIQLSAPDTAVNDIITPEKVAALNSLIATSASSTVTVPAPDEANVSNADKILDEAQKLFDSADYSQAADKLKEAVSELEK